MGPRISWLGHLFVAIGLMMIRSAKRTDLGLDLPHPAT